MLASVAISKVASEAALAGDPCESGVWVCWKHALVSSLYTHHFTPHPRLRRLSGLLEGTPVSQGESWPCLASDTRKFR